MYPIFVGAVRGEGGLHYKFSRWSYLQDIGASSMQRFVNMQTKNNLVIKADLWNPWVSHWWNEGIYYSMLVVEIVIRKQYSLAYL